MTTPALYSTVADLSGNLGLVVGQPMIVTKTSTEVAVEWEDRVTLVDMADLLTETGLCNHGGMEANRCGMDTAPGYEQCEAHGGASPLDVPRG